MRRAYRVYLTDKQVKIRITPLRGLITPILTYLLYRGLNITYTIWGLLYSIMGPKSLF